MPVRFAFTSLADFPEQIDAPAAVTVSTEIGPYVQEGIALNDGDSVAVNLLNPITDTDLWMSWWRGNGGTGNTGRFDFFDTAVDAVNPVIRITGQNDFGGSIVLQLWNGSSFDTVYTSGDSLNALQQIDWRFVKDNSAGLFQLYRNQSLVSEVAGIDTDRVAWTQIDRIRIVAGSSAGGDVLRISAFQINTEDTRFKIFIQANNYADGANTDPTGGAAEVDDIAGFNDADVAVFDLDGDRLTMSNDLDGVLDSGFDIESSVLSVRCNRVGGDPNSIIGVHRVGGTDYLTSSILLPASATQLAQFIVSNNPATASPWLIADLEAAEVGAEAETV